MRRSLAIAAATSTLATAAPAPARSVATPALIPMPAEMTIGRGSLRIVTGDKIGIPAGDAGAARAARQAVDLVAAIGGPRLVVVRDGNARITLTRAAPDPAGPDTYRLDVTAGGIAIAAADDAGLLHGAMTLVQLLTPAGTSASVSVPRLAIRDRPRFAWRGVMLDVARHLLPIAEIRTVIDMMAQHKMNVLQLHLTDDQGWRMEIERYPELTRIGAWRVAPATGSPADGVRYGGFYTQDALRALVAYAADRAITIVPEIDLPGHAQAAIAAYPAIGVLGDRPGVSADWGINPYLFGTDANSMGFVEGVLDEVMAVFPSRFIHVGGDEALKAQWQASPVVQAQMRSLGIRDEDHLQSWFVDRLGRYLAAHGRRLIGWDEILEGGLPASASVMSWRGEAGAIAAATLDHDVVLSPGPTLYFDNLQSLRGDEPPGRLAVQTLATVYAYDPLPAALPSDKAHRVLGAQANLWTEHIVTPAQVDHALFPRLDALAEITWSPRDKRDWRGFLARLEPQLVRYRRQDVGAADSAFAVDFAVTTPLDAILHDKTATIALSTQADHGTITFTEDGSAPTRRSRRYRQPLTLPIGTVLRARSFAADGTPLSATRAIDLGPRALLTRDSAGLSICPGAGIRLRLALTPDARTGPAFAQNISDPCWIYRAAPLALVNRIDVKIGRLARNFALREPQRRAVQWRYNATRYGTLVVHRDACDGPVVASMPIPDPAASDNRPLLSSAITVPPGTTGAHDLCLTTNPPEGGPIYAIEQVALRPIDRPAGGGGGE